MAEYRLIVENGNWGATSLSAIHAVLTSAAGVLSEAFGTTPDAPVRVARWDHDPRAFHDMRPYEIRINARDAYWCQYVHQFSHELCRVMTGFDRFKGHRHKWFEESLCELASLFVLRRLAEVWAEEPLTRAGGRWKEKKEAARGGRGAGGFCIVSLDGVPLRPDGDEKACWASSGTVSFHEADVKRLRLSSARTVRRTTIR